MDTVVAEEAKATPPDNDDDMGEEGHEEPKGGPILSHASGEDGSKQKADEHEARNGDKSETGDAREEPEGIPTGKGGKESNLKA